MFRPTRTNTRRGAILIVTLLLLALFAIIGITMVYYATAQAERARIQGEAQSTGEAEFPDDGKAALNDFIRKWMYGDRDDTTGLLNSMRGHDLMATIYGRLPGAAVPFNGVGNFSETATTAGVDRKFLINYRLYPGAANINDPEYRGERPVANAPGSGGAYIGKNAPYTYPDINNLFLACVCPATGQVLVPSFHRQAAFGSLDPSNANWRNVEGKYLTLRPRPQEHPNFPYPEQNADTFFTGDVKNLVGGYGGNDSIWIDINAPIVTTADGRRYKMLVAPLILDLDGRLNVNVHGNRMLPLTGGAYPDDFDHTSGQGWGPWEVSLRRAFGTSSAEARRVVAARGPAQTIAGQTQKSFARLPAGGQLPGYSPVAWAGFSAANPLQLPNYTTGNQFAAAPTYVGGYDFQNLPFASHPSLFNPGEWQAVAGATPPTFPRAFPLGDTKLLSLRHSFAPSFYGAMDVGAFAPTFLRGATYGVPNPNPPQFNTPSNYRLDPAHWNRNLITTLSGELDRPMLMPMYLDQFSAPTTGSGPGTALYREPTTGLLLNPAPGQMFPNPGSTPGAVTDFASATQWNNVRAALGAIDLNRSLADYRTDYAQPLLPNNMGNEVAARLDRQRLARDIFARLVIVTGAHARVHSAPTVIGMVTYDAGDVEILATNPSPEFNALRQLAQIAANIVDYIDSDDINTPFVWNPQNPLDPQNAANYAVIQMTSRMVYGVEKPRLTLNEVYGEVTNDPADLTADAHVRFWLELQNATSGNSLAGTPIGDGSVRLQYNAAELGVNPSFNPYQVEIVQNTKGGVNVSNLLRDASTAASAANIRGDTGVVADVRFNFTSAGTLRIVPAANGLASGPSIVVSNAEVPPPPMPIIEFNPMPAAGTTIPGAPAGAADSLTYKTPLMAALPGNRLHTDLKKHVVLLRRLANPHLPGPTATNPYITVDFMDNVNTFDAIRREAGQMTDRSAKTMTNPGYDPTAPAVAGDPVIRRHAMGKVQPYAGFTFPNLPLGANQDYPTFTFPNSLVLAQVMVDGSNNPIDSVQHTLGRQNSRLPGTTGPAAATYSPAVIGTSNARLLGDETLMTPYDWLVHLDRPLINQLELLHVTAGKPHELTLQFIMPNTQPSAGPTIGKDVEKHAGTVQWLPAVAPHPYATATPTGTPTGLHRAFELLRVQPYGHQTAFGGHVPGRININTIMDKRVWDALFDAQAGMNGFTQAQVDAMWVSMMQSRTVNMVAMNGASGSQLVDSAGVAYSTPVPGASIYDMNAANNAGSPYDRPFLPFGAPHMTPGSPFALGGVVGLDDTILRRISNTNTPLLWNTAAQHPYLQAEAARKILNNTTTVSNTFAVWLTVGYFEVTDGPALANGQPNHQLGKEYFKEVPGDTRHKFFSIVDRSKVGLDVESYDKYLQALALGTRTSPPSHAQSRPYFTTVEASAAVNSTTLTIYAPSGFVMSDGVPVNLMATLPTMLAIGTGNDREFVTVTAVTPIAGAGGLSTLTVLPLTKNHSIGECVSNVVPGNPGPQPNFDVSNTQLYGAVIPHWSRVP